MVNSAKGNTYDDIEVMIWVSKLFMLCYFITNGFTCGSEYKTQMIHNLIEHFVITILNMNIYICTANIYSYITDKVVYSQILRSIKIFSYTENTAN